MDEWRNENRQAVEAGLACPRHAFFDTVIEMVFDPEADDYVAVAIDAIY